MKKSGCTRVCDVIKPPGGHNPHGLGFTGHGVTVANNKEQRSGACTNGEHKQSKQANAGSAVSDAAVSQWLSCLYPRCAEGAKHHQSMTPRRPHLGSPVFQKPQPAVPQFRLLELVPSSQLQPNGGDAFPRLMPKIVKDVMAEERKTVDSRSVPAIVFTGVI
jgi:hypothetical protein